MKAHFVKSITIASKHYCSTPNWCKTIIAFMKVLRKAPAISIIALKHYRIIALRKAFTKAFTKAPAISIIALKHYRIIALRKAFTKAPAISIIALKHYCIKALSHYRIIALIISILFLQQTSQAQSLDSLLQKAAQNNPELKALEMEYEAELAKVDQVNQLPNPEVGVGVPISGPETRLGPQVLMVSASQMFPWFGTLQSKEDVVIAMSKAKYERISAIKLNLFYELKVAYYKLYTLSKKEKILREYIEIYHSLENVSLARVESGQSTVADVLRVQLKLQSFEQDLKIIDNTKNIFIARINELTNQDFDTRIQPTDSLPEFAPMNFNLENYKQKIRENHPLIVKIEQEMEASKNRQTINNNMGKPSFGVGIDYSLVNERTDAFPIDNGKDILIPKLKVSIPLYRKTYKAKNQEENLKQTGLEFQKEQLTNKMISSLIQNKTDYDNAYYEIMFNYQQIKTTEMAYNVLLSKYSSTGKGFDDLLQMQNQLLKFQLNILQEQLQSYLTRARIERVTEF